MKMRSLVLAAVIGVGVSRAWAAEWPTARGNAQRTGNVDGKAGPSKSPKVLWVHESTDQYISVGSPGEKAIYVPALGTLNSGVMAAMSTDPAVGPAKRVIWSKSQPAIKLPTVCPPAVVGGKLIFGDGMHQNSNPTLYCVDAATGASVWQLAVGGDLTHIEGTPTVASGKAYFGAGSGGVICVDTQRVTLDGKETDAAGVAATIAAKWKELQAKYEEDKKKDPDFAIPPSEDALPKPSPKVVWKRGDGQGGAQGGKAWHVDSPVAVVGDRVLVASAYLDTEKTGDRAVICLGAADGAVKWRAELPHNPWGGPTVVGDLVLVGCSGVRFDPDQVNGAAGEVVAIGLADGQIRWRKEVGAGVLSPVAVAGGAGDTAIFTTTAGKVCAVDVKSGADRWTYEARSPLFAGAAVAGDVVYTADLSGTVHAIGLADGKGKWKLDIGKETKAPGRVYGSPVVDGGRVYVSTCNLDAAEPRKTVVVCIGER